jgi:phage baseplate assembly protein V
MTHRNFNSADMPRQLDNLVQVTTITSVDHANKKLRVQLGDEESAELAWPADQGANYTRWKPLKVGQQVIISSPSGDPAQAVITGELYSDAHDSPSVDPDIDLIQFTNGNLIEHNISTGKFRIVGDIELTGTLTASVDVVAGSISLIGHDHVKKVGRPT